MRLSRNFTNRINWILDNLLPPIVRDSRVLMIPFFWLLFKKKYRLFMRFKKNAYKLSKEQFIEYYKVLSDVHIDRDSDLNNESLDFILKNLEGKNVLDISCGSGHLATLIANQKKMQVTGIDILINDSLKESTNPKFMEGDIEEIPFPDNHFDTVVCSHTLEHVLDIQKALFELRRVCAKKLIIVLPKQRKYRYTFDLHIHFFPYDFDVKQLMDNEFGSLSKIGGDWVYCESTE